MSKNDNIDNRVNLRPYILGVCFAWGTICGFIFNSPPQAEPQVESVKNTGSKSNNADDDNAKSGNKKNLPEEERKPDVEQPPDPKKLIGEIADADSGQADNKPITDDVPPIPDMELSAKWGLTGDTAGEPPMPQRLTKPGPEVPAPVNTDRKWNPINDPELVF